jgi:hypothetical protein
MGHQELSPLSRMNVIKVEDVRIAHQSVLSTFCAHRSRPQKTRFYPRFVRIVFDYFRLGGKLTVSPFRTNRPFLTAAST